jgi:hypothetical protein
MTLWGFKKQKRQNLLIRVLRVCPGRGGLARIRREVECSGLGAVRPELEMAGPGAYFPGRRTGPGLSFSGSSEDALRVLRVSG